MLNQVSSSNKKELMFGGFSNEKMNTGSFEARQKLKLRADQINFATLAISTMGRQQPNESLPEIAST